MKPRPTQRPNPKLAELIELIAEIAVADYLAELENSTNVPAVHQGAYREQNH